MLEAAADDAESMRAALGQLEQETGRAFSASEVFEIKAALENARDGADVLGTLVADSFSENGMRWGGRLAAIHETRLTADNPPDALASNFLHHEVLSELPGILAGRRVSVISCRDIRPVLELSWGLEDVAVYQVPSQDLSRHADGAYEASLHDVPIWPDAHERVRAELTVREPGEVFLVGAGLFGKDLCVLVRERGGIGLDMGVTLDHIAGKVTRAPMREMLALHADGMSSAGISAEVRDRYGVRIKPERVAEVVETILPYVSSEGENFAS